MDCEHIIRNSQENVIWCHNLEEQLSRFQEEVERLTTENEMLKNELGKVKMENNILEYERDVAIAEIFYEA